MHPSIRHYAIRVDRDAAIDQDIPAHRSYRSVRVEARRIEDGTPSLTGRLRAALGLTGGSSSADVAA
jgi:hypothetical protein